MPNTLAPAESASASAGPSRSEPVEGNGWILPAAGAVVLTLLWGAYVIMFTMEILAIPAP